MKMIIGGQWIDKEQKIEVRSKFDQHVVDQVPAADREDVLSALKIAEKGIETAGRMPVHKRIEILKKAAAILETKKEEYARTIASEGVKTIREARREVMRATMTMTIFAEEARRITGETLPFDSMPGSENRTGYYQRVPVGLIAAIVSFNDPLNLCAHKLAPAIAAGNAIILKPSELTPLSGLKLGEALLEAGLPGEILSVIPARPADIGDTLISDPRVRLVSFTGGYKTGSEIIRKAGLKKIMMELGSNSPVIVLEDADLEKAVKACVSGAFAAAGQNCIGVQRIYISKDIFKKFRSAFVEQTKKLKAGNTLDESSDLGPLVSEKEVQRIQSWLEDATSKGAKILTGGTYTGTVFQPTVLSDIPANSIIDKEEVFGPVVSLYSVDSFGEAIKNANDVVYGLHAAIFTENINHAFRAVEELQAGTVLVNDSTDYRIDLMPFGGIKNSGLGREGIKNSILEMTETKVVCFNLNSK